MFIKAFAIICFCETLLKKITRRKGIQRPCEFLGIPIKGTKSIKKIAEKIAESKSLLCPFTCTDCMKKRHYAKESGMKLASGICSVWYAGVPYIICQNRLLENNLIFKKTSKKIFGNEQYKNFRETKVGDYGRVDHIVGECDPKSNKILNFFGLERIAVDTTKTRGLNDAINDCLSGKIGKKYSFGLNFMHTLKLEIIQVILKGKIFEEWEKKYILVLQDHLFNYLQNLTGFSVKDGINDNPIIFCLTALKYDNSKKRYSLHVKGFKSTDVDLFKTQIRAKKTRIPKLSPFIDRLERKLKKQKR